MSEKCDQRMQMYNEIRWEHFHRRY